MSEKNNTLHAVRNEFRSKMVGYIIGAFGLVAGLAWNDAIKSCIELFFPEGGNTLLLKFVYAALITVLVVVVSFYLARLSKEE